MGYTCLPPKKEKITKTYPFGELQHCGSPLAWSKYCMYISLANFPGRLRVRTDTTPTFRIAIRLRRGQFQVTLCISSKWIRFEYKA